MDYSFLRCKAPKAKPFPQPCLALPGTKEKMEVVALRERLGQVLFHSDDATWRTFWRLTFTAPVGSNGRIGPHEVKAGRHEVVIGGRTYHWPVAATPLDAVEMNRLALLALDRLRLETNDVDEDDEGGLRDAA